MSRRAANAWSSVIVALAVMLAVPVAQLRFISIARTCCCPPTKRCLCPDHDRAAATQSTMRACHKTPQVIATPPMPGFQPASGVELAAPARTVALTTFELPRPHAPPPPRRIDAPS